MDNIKNRNSSRFLSLFIRLAFGFHVFMSTLVPTCSAEQFHWSAVAYEAQAVKQACYPTNLYKASVPKQRKNVDNSTMMGKVVDIEVCALLCCELVQCSTAWMKDQVCYSMECLDNLCQIEKATGNQMNSVVLQISRIDKSGKDMKGHSPADVTGVKYDAHKSTIVTKQALVSNSSAVQKSSIPAEHQNGDVTNSKQESLVTISNQSPMEQLLQTESKMIHNKATAEGKAPDKQANSEKKSKGNSISDNIQTLSDHLKKVDEKSDMTALEENDTKTMHPKLKYHRHHDLRHSLISPIIIGAFTCMAVIAVSGFAMAIIKYQKERHDKLTSQSTQTLESN